MMRIVDFLSESLIIADARATTRDALLEELVGRIVDVHPNIEPSHAYRVLLERERLGSTGVGNGFAIPHARLARLSGVVGCFARSSAGVAFGSLDGKPVHLFLALLAPEGGGGIHLKALARASRLFKDAEFRTRLLAVADAATMWSMICAEDKRLAHSD